MLVRAPPTRNRGRNKAFRGRLRHPVSGSFDRTLVAATCGSYAAFPHFTHGQRDNARAVRDLLQRFPHPFPTGGTRAGPTVGRVWFPPAARVWVLPVKGVPVPRAEARGPVRRTRLGPTGEPVRVPPTDVCGCHGRTRAGPTGGMRAGSADGRRGPGSEPVRVPPTDTRGSHRWNACALRGRMRLGPTG